MSSSGQRRAIKPSSPSTFERVMFGMLSPSIFVSLLL